jgi:hypothetical protein
VEPSTAKEPKEGRMTKAAESQTRKVPSMAYLSAAVGSMAVSAALQVAGKEKLSLFIGQWAPSLLVIGLYNKLVKVAGSD